MDIINYRRGRTVTQSRNYNSRHAALMLLAGLVAALCLQGLQAATDISPAAQQAIEEANTPPSAPAPERRIEREGLAIEFVARPAGSTRTPA